MAVFASVFLSAGACRTSQSGYQFGSATEAVKIETKEQMLQGYGVPTLAKPVGDDWLYAYRTTRSRGFAVGIGPFGLLGRVGHDHRTTDVLQFLVSDDGRVRSVTTLVSAPGDDGYR